MRRKWKWEKKAGEKEMREGREKGMKVKQDVGDIWLKYRTGTDFYLHVVLEGDGAGTILGSLSGERDGNMASRVQGLIVPL